MTPQMAHHQELPFWGQPENSRHVAAVIQVCCCPCVPLHS